MLGHIFRPIRAQKRAVAKSSIRWSDFGLTRWRNRRRRCSATETLEDRTLLAANPIGEQFLVNEAFSLESGSPAIAVLNDDGDLVAAWESYEEGEDYLGYGVYLQRFESDGTPIDTDKILVNADQIAGDQLRPSVASDGNGNYLVAWQSKDPEGGQVDIYARWFVDGLLSDAFPVNTYTDGDQAAPSVSMDSSGNAVIAWQSDGQDGDGSGIFAKQFTLGATDVAADVPVNTQTALNQTAPDVAVASGSGQFVIVWEGAVAEGAEASLEIFARRFAADGSPLDLFEFQVNQETLRDQVTPEVAAAANGDFAVAWVSEGIPGSGSDVFGRLYGSDAVAVDDEFRVNVTTQASQVGPAVGMSGGGEFVIAWQSVHLDGYSWGIYAHEYQASGDDVVGKEQFQINNYVRGPQNRASVAVHPDGTTLFAWVGNDETHTPAVHAKNYELPGVSVPEDVPDLVLANFVAMEDVPADAVMDAEGRSAVVWQSHGEDGDGLGVFARLIDAEGEPIGDVFLVNAGMELGDQSHPAIAGNALGQFVVVWEADNPLQAGHEIYGQRFSDEGVPVGERFQVNTTTAGDQSDAAVAMAEDGSFIVVWESPDTYGSGIYGQRFDSEGVTIGDEFPVNFYTDRDQFSPTVAMNATGQHVVAWISDHPVETDPENDPEKSIFVQWYDTDGTSAGPEVLVHEYVKDAQEHPSIGIDAAGNFVATWQSINQEGMHGASWGVYGRQFTADKLPVTASEFHVNQTTNGPQRYSTVGVDADGNFVIAWQSNSHLHDGSSWEVYIRQYDAEGTALRDEELVNTWSTGPQINPIVARATTGNFGIYWTGQGAAHTEGVQGRLYDVNLPDAETVPRRIPVGEQFLAAETFALEGSPPDVAVAADGSFVAAWESFEQDGSGWGVSAQRYDSFGAPVDDPFLVNSYAVADQHAPAVASDADGNVLIVWQSNGQDGDGFGVYGQWYGSDGIAVGDEFHVSTDAVVGDQLAPDVAMISVNGGVVAVVTWQSSDTDGTGILAKWYTAIGDTTGSEPIVVNTLEAGDQTVPTIAMAAVSEQFVITWQGPGPIVDEEPHGVLEAAPAVAPAADPGEEEEASLEIFAQLFAVNTAVGEVPLYVRDGGEITVNSILEHDQVAPAVAMDDYGNFAVTFVSEGQIAAGSDVYARQFSSAGVPVEPEFPVTSETLRPQRSPAVGMNAVGDFLITWQSVYQPPDPFSWGIFGRAYNAAGVTIQDEFLVNTLTSGPQTSTAVGMNGPGETVVTWIGLDSSHHPAIHAKLLTISDGIPVDIEADELVLANYLAPEESPPAAGMATDGTSVVVWQSYNEDGSGLGVFGQRVGILGELIGDVFPVNTEFTQGNQSEPAMAMNADGEFVVVWQSEDQDGSGFGISAQRFAADATRVGPEIAVNAATAGDQTLPDVAIAADGSFVVVWQGPDLDGTGIYARRFGSDGVPIDPLDIPVNTETGLDQFAPTVAMNAFGQFAVAWVSDHPALVDPNDTEKSVFLQWYDADLSVNGPEVLVHEFVKDAQERPDVAIDPTGKVTVVWQSINQDGNTWGVLARQFDTLKEPLQRREFIVNETRLGPQRFASVGVDDLGQIVVTWQSISYKQEGSSWDIYCQQYSPEATPQGHETAVNTWNQGPQILPVVGQSPQGDFAIYWVGQGTENSEGVHGRIFRQHDFGDAQHPFVNQDTQYPTLLADDGARHLRLTPLYLGASVDIEGDGQPHANAKGDDSADLDDEDGITLLDPLIPGKTALFEIEVSDPSAAGAFVDAWIDLNSDGDWTDPGEQFLVSLPVVDGVNTFAYDVPAAPPGPPSPASSVYLRFRLSSAGGLTPSGLALDGEVEDYRFTIFPTARGRAKVDKVDVGGNLGLHDSTPLDSVLQLEHVAYVTPAVDSTGSLWEDLGLFDGEDRWADEEDRLADVVVANGSVSERDGVSGPARSTDPLSDTLVPTVDPTSVADSGLSDNDELLDGVLEMETVDRVFSDGAVSNVLLE